MENLENFDSYEEQQRNKQKDYDYEIGDDFEDDHSIEWLSSVEEEEEDDDDEFYDNDDNDYLEEF